MEDEDENFGIDTIHGPKSLIDIMNPVWSRILQKLTMGMKQKGQDGYNLLELGNGYLHLTGVLYNSAFYKNVEPFHWMCTIKKLHLIDVKDYSHKEEYKKQEKFMKQ